MDCDDERDKTRKWNNVEQTTFYISISVDSLQLGVGIWKRKLLKMTFSERRQYSDNLVFCFSECRKYHDLDVFMNVYLLD